MAQERIFRVKLLIPGLDAIRGLALDNECMPIHKRQDGQIEMEAIVPESTLTKLRRMRKKNVSVEVIAEPEAQGKEASQLISRTNRYADGSLPRGLGSQKE